MSKRWLIMCAGWLLAVAVVSAQDAPRKIVPAGGWSIDNRAFAVSYLPTRHADGFMKSWLSISAEHAKKSEASGQVFKHLADKKQAGQCMKCHSVDQIHGGSHQVNWASSQPHQRRWTGTRFSHAPHLLVLKDDAGIEKNDEQSGSCFTCHNLSGQSTGDFTARYFDENGKITFDVHSGMSNFTPITRNTCASCHQENVAGDSCTLCHLYHHK